MSSPKNSLIEYLLKGLSIIVCLILFIFEFFFFYLFTSPVDPGFQETPLEDMVMMLTMTVIKVLGIIFIFIGLRKNYGKMPLTIISIILLAGLFTLSYIPVLSLRDPVLSWIRNLIPILLT